MKLTGEAMLRSGVDEVYAALHDPAVLVRTIPGCQRLEQVGADAYRASVLAGVASIKGVFDGDVRLADQVAAQSFTLHASGAGAPGTVSAVARISLAPIDGGGTLLSYDADATIGGMIGGVGQRMIAGVARKTAAEFFANVDRQLAGVPVPAPPAGVEPAPLAGVESAPPAGVEPAPGASVVSPRAPAEPVSPRAGAEPVSPRAGAEPVSPRAGAEPSPVRAGGVWTAPPPVRDPARQRVRDLMVGAVFGAIVALLGVLVGAIVAGW